MFILKIGMISGYDPIDAKYGGAETSFYALAKALASLGIEVHFITMPHLNVQRKVEEVNGVYIHRVLSGLRRLMFSGGVSSVMLSSYTIMREIEKIHRKEKFDLIHTCNRNTAVGGVIASKKLNVPCVLHIREYWPICPTSALQRYYIQATCGHPTPYCIGCHFQDFRGIYGNTRALLWSPYSYLQTIIRRAYVRKATLLIAISEFMKRFLVNNGFDANRIRIVPNPVESTEVSERKNKSSRTLLFVGKLAAHKGVFDAICVLKFIQNAGLRDVELRIVGDGPHRNILEKFIVRHGVNNVKILGWVPYNEVLKEYVNADIAILPFRRPEPFGRVIVEAMMARLPVVSYSVGAVPEIVEHMETGILVQPYDIKLLAEAVKSLLVDERLRRTLGENARNMAIEKYSPRKVAEKVKLLYEKLLQQSVR